MVSCGRIISAARRCGRCLGCDNYVGEEVRVELQSLATDRPMRIEVKAEKGVFGISFISVQYCCDEATKQLPTGSRTCDV